MKQAFNTFFFGLAGDCYHFGLIDCDLDSFQDVEVVIFLVDIAPCENGQCQLFSKS